MLYKYYFLGFCICIYSFNLKAKDTLHIQNLMMYPELSNTICGVGAESINDQIVVRPDGAGGYDSSFINPTLLAFSRQMRLSVFRFPGGTLGNFYHFSGIGYGLDSTEIVCAPGRVGSTFASQYYNTSSKAPRNYIYDFNEQLQTLKNDGSRVGLYYMLNINTHYYQKDMVRYNDAIYQKLLYYSNNNPILNTTGDAQMDSVNLPNWVNFLNLVLSDTFFLRMKTELARDSAFKLRFQENLSALRYFKSQGIDVLGAEIGNETYAEYILFDDDLKDAGYDCTNAPQGFYISTTTAPLKTFLKGLLKFRIVASLYSDSLRAMGIKVGIPYAETYSYLSYNENLDSVLFVESYNSTTRRYNLWNAFLSAQSGLADAAIPHIYFQQIANCDFYTNEPQKGEVHRLLMRFFEHYGNYALPKMITRCSRVSGKKEIWNTEWGFDGNSYSSNTMLSSFYVYNYLHAIENLNLTDTSLKVATTFHAYASASPSAVLLRVTSDYNSYVSTRQMMCYPFEMLSNTLAKNVHKLNNEHHLYFNRSGINADVYYSDTYKTVDILYANRDTMNDYIVLRDKVFIINGIEYEVSKILYYALDGAGYTSNNFTTCSTVAQENTYFRIFHDSTTTILDSLPLPSIAIGKYTLELSPKITTKINLNQQQNVRIFPNPASEFLTLEMPLDNEGNWKYAIIASDGKEVFNGTIIARNEIISIANLSPGYYVVRFFGDIKFIENQSFIKLK